jgi:hypothetical protein
MRKLIVVDAVEVWRTAISSRGRKGVEAPAIAIIEAALSRAREEGVRLGLDAAAKVADEGRGHWRDKCDVTKNSREGRDYETMAIACVHVSAAISALDPAAIQRGE